MPGQSGADIFCRVIEVPGEFHFPVTDSGHLGQGPVKVALQGISNRVKLQADSFDFLAILRPCESAAEQRRGSHGSEETSAVHSDSSFLVVIPNQKINYLGKERSFQDELSSSSRTFFST